MGRIDEAIVKQQASLEIAIQQGNERGQAYILHRLSILSRMKNEYPRALEYSQESEKLNHKLNNSEVDLAANLHEQGVIFTQLANSAKGESVTRTYLQYALNCFTQILDISRRIKYPSGIASTLGELSKLMVDDGQYSKSITYIQEAMEIHQKLSDPASLGLDLGVLGLIHERQGQYTAALEKYQQALGLFKQYSSPQEVARAERNIARVQSKLRGKNTIN